MDAWLLLRFSLRIMVNVFALRCDETFVDVTVVAYLVIDLTNGMVGWVSAS